MGEGGRGNSPAAEPPVTIVTVQLRTHSMHALYLRDLAGSEAVTLHDTREEARSSMIEHIRTHWPTSLGERPLDDTGLIERYFGSGTAVYAIASVKVDR